jgi:hypothetical protein
MLSTLPKLADKSFILGFFLPSLLFIAALLALFVDIPWAKTTLDAATDASSLEKLVVFIIAVWILAVLMLLVNRVQYQILEGIRWPVSKLRGLKIGQTEALEELRRRRDTLRQRQKTIKPFPRSEYQELQRILRDLSLNFPRDATLLLPTRFGNAIRAFEHYANDVYGADSVTIWPHLNSVVPKQFHDALGDARSQVDCLVNIGFFSTIIALTAIGRLLWNIGTSIHVTPFTLYLDRVFVLSNLYLVIGAFAAAFFSILAYQLSIERIHSWGRLVRAAFDCYLPALAKRLGYELPKTADGQRKFWTEVSQRVIYHRVLKSEQWVQASPLPATRDPREGTPSDDDRETRDGEDESVAIKEESEMLSGDDEDD